VYLFNKYGRPIGYDLWEALGRQLDWPETSWQLLDDGIWESRGGRRRFTYSALMTGVAFERAIRIGRQRGLPAPIAHWRDIANSSYEAVQREGWSPDRRAYVQYPGRAPSVRRSRTPARWAPARRRGRASAFDFRSRGRRRARLLSTALSTAQDVMMTAPSF
jgi:GH15 family glucan-1,4-alpha-glucosidase